jgi:hypothetical protein
MPRTLEDDFLAQFAAAIALPRHAGGPFPQLNVLYCPFRALNPMTPLRAKYIQDLVIRGRSKYTQEAYTRYVCDLARYYRRSQELISYEEVTGWLYHLIKELPSCWGNPARIS